MTEKTHKQPLININQQRLKHFFVRLFAGIGIINVWIVLLLVSGLSFASAITWLSHLPWFQYAVTLAFVPAVIFCWYVCYFLSFEFLTEIGIELNGVARYMIIPVAVPLAAFSFILSLWVSAGESIGNKRILVITSLLGVGIVVAVTSVFL